MQNNELVQAEIFDALVPFIREIMTADSGFMGMQPGPLVENTSDNHIIFDLPDNLVLDREALSKYCDLRNMDIHAQEPGWRQRPFHRTVTLHFTNAAAFFYLRDKFFTSMHRRGTYHESAPVVHSTFKPFNPGELPPPQNLIG